MPHERLFGGKDDITYGTVVIDGHDGYKSALYGHGFAERHGVATHSLAEAQAYADMQFAIGNRVRVKDPRESDGKGQITVSSSENVEAAFEQVTLRGNAGAVLMPYLTIITERPTRGRWKSLSSRKRRRFA